MPQEADTRGNINVIRSLLETRRILTLRLRRPVPLRRAMRAGNQVGVVMSVENGANRFLEGTIKAMVGGSLARLTREGH